MKINVQPTIICEVEEDTAVAGLVSVNYGVAIVPRISFLDQFNVKILTQRSTVQIQNMNVIFT